MAFSSVAEVAELNGVDSEGGMPPVVQSNFPCRRMRRLMVAGMSMMALLAAVSVTIVGLSVIIARTPRHDSIMPKEQVDQEWDAEPTWKKASCDDLVLIKPVECILNNLGGKGPDSGSEAMIFRAKVSANDSSIDGRGVLIAVRATTPYNMDPLNRFNGKRGKFFAIGVRAGTEVSLQIRVYDEATKQPLVLPHFSISFFDLDVDPGPRARKYVIARDFQQYYVAHGSQISVDTHANGSTKFRAMTPDVGLDNPVEKESEALTDLSKSKGVTLQYFDRDSIYVTVGAEDGGGIRGFLFSLRPSIICTKSRIGGQSMDPQDMFI